MNPINFLNHINLNRNEIQNPQLIKAQIDNQINDAAVGGTPVEGQLYFNTTIDALKIYANSAWVEVGATSGVETFTNANGGTYVAYDTVYTGAIGPINIGNVDLTAVDGTSTSASKFLTKDNKWATVPFGDITAVLPGTYINVDNSTGPEPTINHDLTSRTDTSSSASPGYGVSFTAVDSVSTNSTGHVTDLNLKTITLPASDNTDNYVDSISFNISNGELTLGRTGSLIDLVEDLDGRYGLLNNQTITLTGDVTGSGTTSIVTTIAAGAVDFAMVNPAVIITEGEGIPGNDNDTTWPTSAAVKNYVDQSNIGQSIFQGGYNAATNTPNLDVAPSALIKKGWFWAVTVTGDFFAEEVQPGDLIYANQDNPGATFANWTVVQSGQDIAGQGTTDGNTRKGLAGFNSAHFNVTAAGWVSSDIYGGASTLGIVPSGGTNTKFLRGDGTWVLPTNTAYTAGTGLTLNGSAFDANVDGTQSVAGNASTTTAARTYKVQVDSGDNLVVNVPWIDTNTQTITSVSGSAVNDRLGIKVTPTTGTPKVGLGINTLTSISAPVAADTLPIYDLSTTTNKSVTVAQLTTVVNTGNSKTGTIDIGDTVGTVTHNFGLNTMVQTFDASSGATVYCDVVRDINTPYTVTATINSTSLTAITILVQKIG